jgi:hypothetical protein
MTISLSIGLKIAWNPSTPGFRGRLAIVGSGIVRVLDRLPA